MKPARGASSTRVKTWHGRRSTAVLLFFFGVLGFGGGLLAAGVAESVASMESVTFAGVTLVLAAAPLAIFGWRPPPDPVLMRQAREAVAQSEHLYRLLADNVSDMVLTVDPTGRVTYASPSAQRLTGYASDELSRMRLDALLVRPSAKAYVAAVAALRDAAEGAPAPRTVEIALRRSDGQTVATEASVALLRDPAGRPVGSIASIRDITERKLAERRIAETHELRARFIQIVAHQLRTPLNSMRWNLESLMSGELGPVGRAQREFLRITHAADVEVIRRIHELLAALDIEEGRVTLARQPLALEALWRRLWPEIQRRCKDKGLRCTSRPVRQPLPPLSADEAKLTEALRTLAENAVTYTPSGGSVVTRWTVADGLVRFAVTDTGIGIPAQDQGRVFQRFFRASNAANAQPDASGVALSNAKYYVEAHGGTVGFQSEEGRGSTFWIELPA